MPLDHKLALRAVLSARCHFGTTISPTKLLCVCVCRKFEQVSPQIYWLNLVIHPRCEQCVCVGGGLVVTVRCTKCKPTQATHQGSVQLNVLQTYKLWMTRLIFLNVQGAINVILSVSRPLPAQPNRRIPSIINPGVLVCCCERWRALMSGNGNTSASDAETSHWFARL